VKRIKSGDPEVGFEDLEQAERRIRFARVKVEGEEQRKGEEVERERLERIATLFDKGKETQDPKRLEKLKVAADKALDALVAELVARNEALGEIATELDLLGPLPKGVDFDHGSAGPNLSVDGREYRSSRPAPLIRDQALEVLRRHIT
jgi:hypothetical protein